MSTSFHRNRGELRDKVFTAMGVIDPDETPTAAEASAFYEALDMRLKSLHSLGLLWFKVGSVTTNTTLTVADGTEAAPSDMLYMIQMFARDSSTDSPVEIITHREYQAIANKTDTGIPTQCYVDQEAQLMYLYPVPDSAYSLRQTYAKIVDDSADNTDVDVPAWALRPLVQMLKYDLADSFMINEEKVRRWAGEERQAMKDFRRMNHQVTDHTPVEVVNY